MRRTLICLMIAMTLAASSSVVARHLPEGAYIPTKVCAHRYDLAAPPNSHVCQFQLAAGERHFNLDMVSGIGGSGSFKMQAAFEDGVIFFEAECSRGDDGSSCTSWGWHYGGRGVTSTSGSGTGLIVLVLLREGVTASMPGGGTLTVWAGPSQAGGFAVRSDG